METPQLSERSVIGPMRGRPVLLLHDPQDPLRYLLRPLRWWDWCVVQLLASSLDRRLAAGHPPESGRFLAVRAQKLVSPSARRVLVGRWEHVLEMSRQPPAGRSSRAPLCRDRILAVDSELREMLLFLSTPRPTAARGVAMVHLLLGDGTGPLWNRRCPDDLRSVLRAATAQLDPAASLADLP